MKTTSIALHALLSPAASALNLRAGGRKLIEERPIKPTPPPNEEAAAFGLFDAAFDAAALVSLAQEVTWPGGKCPTLPADPDADGWTLIMEPNDDSSSSLQSIGFHFDFFGTNFDNLYVNNNGNLSFENPYGTFTAVGFPSVDYHMVAPFWADVDTRNSLEDLGHVWAKAMAPSRNVYAVAWDNVGYFSEHGDKRNTFMVMISDGNDSDMGSGNNVCFCYSDMQWTTGDASGGSEGFGGTPATVGANKGDGVAYQAFGRYDALGAGPTGIDLLDNRSFCFATSTINQPPVAIGLPQDNQILFECDGEPVAETINFSGPEGNQLVHLMATVSGDAGGLSVVVHDDNTQTPYVTINWEPTDIGAADVTITATDDGAPSMTSTFVIHLVFSSACIENLPPEAICHEDLLIDADSNCLWSPTESELISLIDNESSDPNEGDGDTTTLSINNVGPFGPDTQEVILTATDSHNAHDFCRAYVTAVDVTDPSALCTFGPNPDGVITGVASNGFFTASGADNCAVTSIYIIDKGTTPNHEFGPFHTDTVNFKWTKAQGRGPTQKSGSGVVDVFLSGKGNAYIRVEDSSGNTQEADCPLTNPETRRLK